LAGVLVLPLLASGGSEPARGELWVSVLDVGQGLAVVVRTSGNALVYDTGARFSDRFDAGSAVLLPYLRSVGLKHVDLLVVTHSDNDHSGGAQAVLEGIPVRKFVSGEPPDSTGRSATRCQSGDAWHWDGVEFRFLHPQSPGVHDGNNASCVLHIRHPRGTVLLTGDIEAGVERELLQRDPDLLDVDLVTVPHHGSRTSSIEGFVDALSPDYAVVAAGYRNRYGFPKPDVVERWRRRGATVLNTSDTGAIRFRLGPGGLEPVESYRSQKRRFWRTVTSHESRGRAPFKESDH
jgi:competence protein ComEC